jgi:MerR family transcriptional regulator, light-induced transcriptional regulator
MADYSIKELEKLSGIHAHTIRIWEKRYQLVNPRRTSTNIRIYSDEDLKKLLSISFLNNNGIKISKLAQLNSLELARKVIEMTGNSDNYENYVERFIIHMIELDELEFTRLFRDLEAKIGFEEVMTKIMYSFFVRIGVLWQTGSINPAQEHFVSNLLRMKLFSSINRLMEEETPIKQKIIFFLPDGELHEIGLLFYCYLARKQGNYTIYLGQSLPFNDLVEVVNIHQSCALVTAITSTNNNDNVENYLTKLHQALPEKKIFVLVPQLYEPNPTIHNLQFFSGSTHFMELIQHL